MAGVSFDHKKLLKATYDPNEPLDAAKFQNMVLRFMEKVRQARLQDPSDRHNGVDRQSKKTIKAFCNLVSDKEVWGLAQMVVPEFRAAMEEQ